MTKQEKINLVADLKQKLEDKPNIYIADTGGLSVAEVNDLRRACHEAGVEMKVVKNTLLKRALEEAEGDYSELYETLKQPSSVFFIEENLNAPAKVFEKHRKDTGGEKPQLKGAYLDSAIFIGDDKLKELAKLKSKQELIGEIVNLLQSPAKNVISALKSGGNTLSGLVKALGEREE